MLKEKTLEVLKAVTPLIVCAFLIQFGFLHVPAGEFMEFLGGWILAIIGMVFLFVGVDYGILPMGRFIGGELPKKGSLLLIVAVTFALGFSTTVAEPDVLVLAEQADIASGARISRSAVLYTIATGLSLFVSFAMMRILLGWSMKAMLGVAFACILLLAFLVPAEWAPLGFDAGSVTTGVVSSPMIIALAMGLSSVLAGRSAASDGFGLLGFGSIGAIIAILIMGAVMS